MSILMSNLFCIFILLTSPMKPKKICENLNCNRFAFGKFCNLHRPWTPLKTKKSLTPRKKTNEQKAEKKRATEEMWKFFLEIWNERPHRCEVTGKFLGKEPLTTMFHHLLPKQDSCFPQYKFKKWNIALIHPDIHTTVEQNMDLVPKLKERYLELLQAHKDCKLPNF
jgi:hypothetical protein